MARRWAATGHSVFWLTTGFRGAPERETIDGVRVRRVGNPVTIYALIPAYYVLRLRGKFDAIVDSENGIPFYSPLYSNVAHICVMHHVHKRVFEENLPFPISAFFVWLELAIMPLVYRRARFVAVSETTRDEMQRYRMSAREVPIVYNGVDARLVPGPKATVPTIAYLGRLKKYKRVDLLVRAMPSILAKLASARLVIAGDGDQRDDLTRLAGRLGVSGSVDLLGFIDEATKAALLAKTWVFASASSMEGWGISVIEANASGTTAVVADSPGLSVAVDHGVTGIVAPPEEIGRQILGLLEDDERRERLAAAALERSKQFSWDRAAAAMLDVIYDEIAASREPVSAAATLRGS